MRRHSSAARRDAVDKVNAYIDWLVAQDRTPEQVASTDGTDGWLLAIDQYAMEAARQERKSS